MAGERAAIFGRFIEGLSESELGNIEREETYRIILEVLEEFDIKGIEGYLDIDPAFDEVWNEKYPPEIEDFEE
jgi:hypothetical protein